MPIQGELYFADAAFWTRRGRPSIPGTSRETLVLGKYRPDATTTGVLPFVERRDFNRSGAPLIVDAPGTVFENLNIWGDIKVRAAGVRFRNCRAFGGRGVPAGNTGIIDANHLAVKDLLIQDCTIAAEEPSYYRDGVVGHDYTASRNHIYNVNDGMGAFSLPTGDGTCNVKVYGNYVHDLVFWKNDPAHDDGTHNDCLQIQGGANIHVRGNNFIGSSVDAPGSGNSANADLYPGNPRGRYLNGQCVILNQNTHILSNTIVEDNWFQGGSAQLALNRGTKYPTLTAITRNNRFGEDIYTFYPPNPDRRWVALTGRAGIKATDLYETSRFTESGALLTEGRATGIRVVSE